jgi:hypothetical protein
MHGVPFFFQMFVIGKVFSFQSDDLRDHLPGEASAGLTQGNEE